MASTGLILAWASVKKPSALRGILYSSANGAFWWGMMAVARVTKSTRKLTGPLQNLVRHRDLDLAVCCCNHGGAGQAEADENHPHFPSPLVEELPFPVGPHIPKKDIGVQVGIHLFKFYGVFHRVAATHLIAIRALRGREPTHWMKAAALAF